MRAPRASTSSPWAVSPTDEASSDRRRVRHSREVRAPARPGLSKASVRSFRARFRAARITPNKPSPARRRSRRPRASGRSCRYPSVRPSPCSRIRSRTPRYRRSRTAFTSRRRVDLGGERTAAHDDVNAAFFASVGDARGAKRVYLSGLLLFHISHARLRARADVRGARAHARPARPRRRSTSGDDQLAQSGAVSTRTVGASIAINSIFVAVGNRRRSDDRRHHSLVRPWP